MKDPEPPHIRFAGFKSCLTDTTILAMIELQLTIQLADFCFLDVVATSFFFLNSFIIIFQIKITDIVFLTTSCYKQTSVCMYVCSN